MGSKRRIGKYIIPIMMQYRKEGQCYVEPFLGGGNSMCLVNGYRIGGDINKYLIALWKGLTQGRRHDNNITKDFFDDVRKSWREGSDKYDDFTKGYVGFMASAKGRFFSGGYSGTRFIKSINKNRNYIEEFWNNIEKQIPYMKDVVFEHCSYEELNIPKNSLIYCDIPYRNTKQYIYKFDYEKFYDWCREMKNKGHIVFVSEYECPNDFECVWSMPIKDTLNNNKTFHKTEKLFKV